MGEPANATERPRRIIEAATELLARFGYRKVTVEDIATKAGSSKSAVYLHWPTKDDVFAEVLIKERLDLLSGIRALVQRKPAAVRPHHLAATYLVGAARRPLIRALDAKDCETLGPLAKVRPPRLRTHDETLKDLHFRYYHCLFENSILRPGTNVPLAVSASKELFRGMILSLHEIDCEDGGRQAQQRMAAVIAGTIKRAFEPLHEPSTEALARAAEASARLFADVCERNSRTEPVRTCEPVFSV